MEEKHLTNKRMGKRVCRSQLSTHILRSRKRKWNVKKKKNYNNQDY